MFDHFVWSVLVAPVLVLAGAWLLADRLRPDLALRVLVWSSVVAAVTSTANVVVFALEAVAGLPTAQVPWLSWGCLVWIGVVAIAVAGSAARRRRAVRAVRAEVAWLEPSGDVVLVDDGRIDAFALPRFAGQDGRIVVTTGIFAALSERQCAAVIAHERAHLAGDHHRLMTLARMSAIAHPVLWPVVRMVAYLVERAADEAAAAELGGRRRDVAQAIGLAALAASSSGGRRSHVLAAVGASSGVVPRRVSALMTALVHRRWPSLLMVVLAAGTMIWTAECIVDLRELLLLAAVR